MGSLLSIVIPAFNEADRLGRTLQQITLYAARSQVDCEIIVVDDGSTDGTADLVRTFHAHPATIRLLANPGNRGKGHSVRRGVLAATGDPILVCDADLSAPIEELAKLRPWLDRGYDVAIGSRDQPDSRVNPPQPLARRLLARVFRAIRRRLLLPNLYDTQCGFKLFRRQAARDVFGRAAIDGWLFDCEVLGLADRLGYRIREVGVTWGNVPGSRVRLWREAWAALPTLLKLRRRLGRPPGSQVW